MMNCKLLKFEDLCTLDDYCRLGRNVNQKIYKNRANGKIDYNTGKRMIRQIVENARKYFLAEMSAVDFLTSVANIEKLRCELVNADLTTNAQYQELLNLIAYEKS